MKTIARRPARPLDSFPAPIALHITPGWQDGVLRLAVAVEKLAEASECIRRVPMDSPTFRDMAEDIIEHLLLVLDAINDEADDEDEVDADIVPARSDSRVGV